MLGAISWRRAAFAQALAGEFDAVGVVNDAVQNGVGQGGNADQVVPAVHGNLAGDDDGALVVAIPDDFEEIARLVGIERLRPPVVQDQQLYAGERAQKSGVTGRAVDDGEIGEETGNADVENGDVLPARLVPEGAGEPTFSDAGRTHDILPKNKAARSS